MKDFMTFWSPKYSVVSTSDTTTENCTKSSKSLNAKRTFCRGFSILDQFFHKREAGKQTRCPKSKSIKFTHFFKILFSISIYRYVMMKMYNSF